MNHKMAMVVMQMTLYKNRSIRDVQFKASNLQLLLGKLAYTLYNSSFQLLHNYCLRSKLFLQMYF